MTTRETIEAQLDAVAKEIEGATEFIEIGYPNSGKPELAEQHVCRASARMVNALRTAILNIEDERVLATVLEHLRP